MIIAISVVLALAGWASAAIGLNLWGLADRAADEATTYPWFLGGTPFMRDPNLVRFGGVAAALSIWAFAGLLLFFLR
jgi:hypothetical protein